MALPRWALRLVRLLGAGGLAVSVAALLALAAPGASAATGSGWLRLAHLSPNTPAVDVYLYSFGDPSAMVVLRHVSYGTVSPYERVADGEYTVAMRLAGAPASSKPVLSTTINVVNGDAYTVAGMGPAAGLRLQVFRDLLTTPHGKALVRVIQASMHQNSVTVTAGKKVLGTNLSFTTVTSYQAVKPGELKVHAAGTTEHGTDRFALTAGTIYTIVILDSSGELKVDPLTDSAGSQVTPAGGATTGLGGTAPRPGTSLLPWLGAAAAGLLVAAGGMIGVRRRRAPAMHSR
jgi:Domain of unknown function (DUF4397)